MVDIREELRFITDTENLKIYFNSHYVLVPDNAAMI